MLLTGLLWLAPGQAAAHLVSTRFGELYSGMLHPLTTLQHVVPWLALGLLGGLQQPRTARWALVAFPMAVLAGTTCAEVLPVLTLIDTVNALSFVILGLLVALGVQLGAPGFVAIVVLFGWSHGFANAAPDLQEFAFLLYASGVGLVAYLVIALVCGGAHALAAGQPWGSIAVRAAGSWIAAAGTMYVGFLLFVT